MNPHDHFMARMNGRVVPSIVPSLLPLLIDSLSYRVPKDSGVYDSAYSSGSPGCENIGFTAKFNIFMLECERKETERLNKRLLSFLDYSIKEMHNKFELREAMKKNGPFDFICH